MANNRTGRRGYSSVHEEPFTLLISVDVHQSSPTQSSVTANRCAGGHAERVNFNNGLKKQELERERDSCLSLLNDAASRQWAAFNQPLEEIAAMQRRGRDMFELLFNNTDPTYNAMAQAKLERWLDSPNLRAITIASSLQSFPVEALHYGQVLGGQSVQRFIGLRAPTTHLPAVCLDPVYDEDEDEASIGFLGHSGVPSVGKRDDESVFAMFGGISGCRVVEATPLKDTDDISVMDVADVQALFRAFAKKRSVWHITSHMRSSGGVREFTLDNDLPISARELAKHRQAVAYLVGQPLVFLNICDSGVPGAHAANDLAASFTALDAGGVIATHSVINVQFATRFAGRFYAYAFADSSIAESLFKARTDSIREDGNLAALTYFFEAHQDFSLPLAAADMAKSEVEKRHAG